MNRELRELSAGFDSAHAAGAVPGSAVHAGSCSMFTGVRFHAIPSESLRGCKALKTHREKWATALVVKKPERRLNLVTGTKF